MYQIQRLTVDLDGMTSQTVAFENEDLSLVMTYWDSYASGASDANDPYFPGSFDSQGFSAQVWWRIVEVDAGERL